MATHEGIIRGLPKGVRYEWGSVKEAFKCLRATDVRFWPRNAVLVR